MRVTFQRAYGGGEYLETSASQLTRARQQVMSGKRVEKASDDPAAMQRSVEGRGEIGRLETYSRTADSALAKLTAIDTVLSAVVDRLTRAKVATVSAQGSVVSPAQREAAALTLEGLRDALAADLNTQVRGSYVFAGSQATTPPFALVAGSWTYRGDATPVTVDIGPGQTVDVGLDGQALAQGAETTNILNDLETLIAAVRAGDGVGMTAGTAALDRAFARATRAQSGVGVDELGIGERQLQITSTRLAVATRVSKDEDADLAYAISEMNRAQTAYQAALGAIGAAPRTSLLDYLR
ncbi:MAG: flagellar hook-associated protein FlgL [Acidobacteria bacterium]|nr:flagellar hook-associated protein FlgL [Acidobacteriota bacterium]